MGRLLIFLYGIFCYLIALVVLIWFALFVGGWNFLPIHIDSGTPGPLFPAIVINLGLVLLFGLQHSVMARPAFKKLWIRLIHPAAERSTYVLLSGIALALICYYWQALPGTVWQFENTVVKGLMIAGYCSGWLMVFASSYMINHNELMGLQQVYLHLAQKPTPKIQFTDRWLYKYVRHPIQLGSLMGLWFTPRMSSTHLMLSSLLTIYILIGLYYEEKDLVRLLGKQYSDYQKRVRKLLPFRK